MDIKTNLKTIKSEIPADVQLVAVSKTKPAAAILEAYHAGQRIFGENKAQEMADKYNQLPKDIQWHFIGHMQTNKVKYIAPFVSLIHSVDSFKLLSFINKEAEKNNRVIDCLLQFYIATEESKFGFDLNEAEIMLNSTEYTSMRNIRLIGVMGMATFTDNDNLIRSEFKQLKLYFDEIKNKFFKNDVCFKEISMGMSGDYHLAIDEGSTLIRVGSFIFGERNYIK